MQHIYEYRFDRHTIYWTLIYLLVFGCLGGVLYYLYEGGFLSAWFTSFIIALVALMALSIPRKLVVTDEALEIRCLLDITEIRRDEILSAHRVETKQMKWIVPLFGGFGFFCLFIHLVRLFAGAYEHDDHADDGKQKPAAE